MKESREQLRRLARTLRARLEAPEADGNLRLVRRTQAAPAVPPLAGASAGASRGADPFEALRTTVEECRKCPLGASRLKSVFGVGSPRARVVFVGEGPGFQEDHAGEPFIGRAGQLLDRILRAIGLSRDAVYIANIVKCHPMIDPSDTEKRGNDRPPTPEEAAACLPYLEEQLRLIFPRAIVALGGAAAKTLLGEDVPISKIRGLWREYRLPGLESGIRLLPTYHPAALLRNPGLKRDVWTDMKNLMIELAGTDPGREPECAGQSPDAARMEHR